MMTRFASAALLTTLVFTAMPARAQCTMMGGSGGHDHSREAASRVEASEKKQRQTIDRLMADPRGRALLLEAILGDAALVRGLIDRIAEAPEWRGIAAARLAAAGPNRAESRPDSVRSRRPALPPDEVTYRCPMHPEVTARQPANCPKCGMALRRDG